MSKKISELDATTTADGTDVFPLVDVSANQTKKITAANLSTTLGVDAAAAAAASAATAASGAATAAATAQSTANTANTNLATHKAAGGTEHPAATTSVAGFMPSSDKLKLDGISELALTGPEITGTSGIFTSGNSEGQDYLNYLDTAPSAEPAEETALGPYWLRIVNPGGEGPAEYVVVTYRSSTFRALAGPLSNTYFSIAEIYFAGYATSPVGAGLLSAEDFHKLRGIETGADKTDTTNVTQAGAIMYGDAALVAESPTAPGATANINANATQGQYLLANVGSPAGEPADASSPYFLVITDGVNTETLVVVGRAGGARTLAGPLQHGYSAGPGTIAYAGLATSPVAAGLMSAADFHRLNGKQIPVLSEIEPEPINTSAQTGNALTVSPSNHVHAHGDLIGGTLHEIAVPSVSAGFMSAAMAQSLEDLPAEVGNLDGALSQTVSIVNATTDMLGERSSTVILIEDEFVGTLADRWISAIAGTAAFAGTLTGLGNPGKGAAALSVGSTASSYATLSTKSNSFYVGSGMTLRGLIRIGLRELATVPEDFVLDALVYGFIVAGVVTEASSVGFAYRRATSPNWLCRRGTTYVDSGIAVVASSGNTQRLELDVSQTVAEFKINGVVVHTGAPPVLSACFFYPVNVIRTAGSGTTGRPWLHNALLRATFATPRP